MNIQFSERAWEDDTHWQQYDRKMVNKINALLTDISRDDPYQGIGKPEPLKHAFSGFWSRRITDEHRLVYRINDGVIEVAQARYHY
ncbi:MAG: Txe/YoeB family addiction module toxin [Akkermansiaceae bacterium]|nr:Txe/YoeB family addiction module toxin [Verrucomicrobiaceae bacterium]MDG1071640.1 Txe/YoeB family addiction module toxin [Akkermansiaceae bacterium]MDG2323563.1 Txe/YoeB family addiction module toxin [Akkermansiaceae bacterium]